MDSARANILTTFNEVTMMVLIYFMMVFTEFVEDGNTRHTIGFVYIGISQGNLVLHMLSML